MRAVKIAAVVREQLPKFSGATCKGSFVLGSACGHCERCKWEQAHGAKMSAKIVPADPKIDPFEVSLDYVTKHDPQPGGYFVVYNDGYQSYSPPAAFEEGYTQIA